MPSFEAEAIVLRHHPLSEADRIVVFLAREQGKLRAAAPGVKKTKSQLAGALEPFNHLRVELWFKEGKDLGQVRSAELIQAFPGKGTDPGRTYRSFCACSYFAEVAGEVAQDNQPNPVLFRLLLATLRACAKTPPTPALVRYFEVWTLRVSGLLPDLTRCSACGRGVSGDSGEGFRAWVEAGEVRCGLCAEGRGLHLGAKSAATLEKMMQLPPEEFMGLPVGQDTLAELEKFTQRLLGFHLERELKSCSLLREALQA